MAQKNINTGALPNDHTGDPLRTAMIFTQNNFTELYTTAPISNSVNIGNTTSNVTANSTTLKIGNSGTFSIANSSGVFTGTVNASVISTGAPLTGTGGLYINTTSLIFGNNTVNSSINSTSIMIGGNVIANSTGANNAFNLGGFAAANYVLVANLNANIASYLPIYAGIVNATSHTAGSTGTGSGGLIANTTTVFIGNNTVNASVNTSGFYINGSAVYQTSAGLSANIASYLPTYTGVVNGSSHATGSAFVANTSGLYVNGVISLAGSNGSSGYVLTSNGNSNVYWASVSSVTSINTLAQFTWSNVQTFTGNVVINSGLFANGSYGTNGFILISDGSRPYWASPPATNAAASYSWTNTHSFSNTITASIINATSYNSGSTGTGSGGLVANATTIFVGNNTINAVINTTSLSIGGNPIANSTGANNAFNLGGVVSSGYQTTAGLSANIASFLPTYTGVVNAASITIGATVIANSSGTYDSLGNLRSIPIQTKSAVYQLASSDNGTTISTTANVTVNGAVLSTGQIFNIFNNSAASITITQGSSVTMYLAGLNSTGNRTLANYGVATVLMVGSNTFVISGAGIS